MYTFDDTSTLKRKARRNPIGQLGLPAQHPPIDRGLLVGVGAESHLGVDTSVSCRGLTGLARQMCRDLY